MSALLRVDNIEVVYKHVITAVQGVTLSVAEKQIVALLGTNGAGKTTTLRAISGFLGIDDARVTEGVIEFEAGVSKTGSRMKSLRAASCWCPSATKFSPTLRSLKMLQCPQRGRCVRGTTAGRGAGLSAVSTTCQAAAPDRRAVVRRRTADARHRQRSDVSPEDPAG